MFAKQSNIYRKYKFHQYSLDFFKLLKPFIIDKKIASHHDLACGSGEFVAKMFKEGVKTSGSDISPEMIALAKQEYPKPLFTVEDMSLVVLENRVDLITINYFAINILNDWNKWKNLFANVHKSLNDNGYFIFDMASIGFIRAANITSFRKINNDYLGEEIESSGEKCKFTLTWFQQQLNGKFIMNEESYNEISFPFEQVAAQLKTSGFKSISFFNEINENPDENLEGLRVVAQK